jgi:multicomponent Na+:H+ antiporter subunit D
MNHKEYDRTLILSANSPHHGLLWSYPIYVKTHKLEIPDLNGLGRQMPITFGAFTIGALGLAGTPLCVGFISKWNLGLGALQSEHPLFLIVLVISGLLNFAYFFPIIYRGFFGNPEQTVAFDEAPVTVWLPLALTAIASVLFGVYPNLGASAYNLAWEAAERALAGAAAAHLAGGS